MGRVHTSENSVNPVIIGGKKPLDVRTVLQSYDDLKDRTILASAYEGMLVYVVDDSSFYVCHTESRTLTDIEKGWRKVDVDYSVRIVESESNLTDGTTIKFPYRGMMAYVTSNSSLYILLTKSVSDSQDPNNWKKISTFSPTTTSVDKIGIDVAPEGGSGFKITGNTGIIIDDYVNVDNYIKANYNYTSKGVNSFEPNPLFDYDVILSKGGDGYIELYSSGENWIKIHEPNSLGLSVTVDGEEYISDTLIKKETHICFGVDIKFHEGWTISFGDINRSFVDSDYELIDIYRSEYSPEVYAYRKDIDVRILTEDDLVNIGDSIMIDLDDVGGSDNSDNEDPKPLQEVIVNMNNAITKLEQTKSEPDIIDYSEIDQLFS